MKKFSLPANTITTAHLVKWLPVALIILLAYQSAAMTWRFAGYFRKEAPLPIFTSNATPDSTRQGKEVIPDLSALHIFGNAVEKVSNIAPAQAPKTSLNLTLHGVFVDDDPSKSGAIIGTGGGVQKYFKQGQVIDSAAGVTLSEVRMDHVILFRGGHYESLRFPKNKMSTSAVFRPSANTQNRAGRKIVKRSIMENIRVIPVMGGSTGLKGYRLLPRHNRAEYDRLGIRPTDVVVAINGIKLNDQRQAARVLHELNTATRVNVQVERNGSLQTLTLVVSK